ncbi:DUF6314 family protein [uncultured Litoreibacter sp.]|uniref:DUF6314 family protein n=1 Tax=uncultured Litoreibacter sp. TaxID=1392394 RepID=UPI002612D196|nr:DUF6314 family protein [uncultured Litoreibacter sp.]
MARMPKLQDFEGAWVLTRIIEDRMTQAQGRLSGTAEFVAREAGGFDYRETGELTYGSQPPMAATRTYIWEPIETGIAVSFEDGRPFHVIAEDRLMPDANHHCDPDWYHVSYDFTRWPDWRAVWRVVGPRKDYRMLSEYKRV